MAFERRLAAGSEGRLWIADQYAFRLRELSPTGRVRSTLTLGADPRMETVARPAEELEQIRAAAAAAGRRLPENLPGLDSKPNEVILGLTIARDGRVYFVTHAAGRLDLARWNPLLSVLERARLAESALPLTPLSLAAGRHALFLATVGATDGGRWSIPWEAVEAAAWEPFEEDVYLDGSPLPPAPAQAGQSAATGRS